MANNIYYSPQALSDLDEIRVYITERLKNPIAADHTVEGILRSISRLRLFSETGSILRFSNGLNSDYRYVVYGNYLSFYHIMDGDVYIDRILIWQTRLYENPFFGFGCRIRMTRFDNILKKQICHYKNHPRRASEFL